MPIFGLICKYAYSRYGSCFTAENVFCLILSSPTRLFGRVQYSLITSSQPITIGPLTNNTQSNQTNKKDCDICLSFSRYTSNILRVNFDKVTGLQSLHGPDEDKSFDKLRF